MCSLADAQIVGWSFFNECASEGWSGIRNSELLERAEADFDLLITSDQNILYQQNLAVSTIAILERSTNDLRRILTAAVSIEKAVEDIRPGQFVRLEIAVPLS